MFLQTSNKPGRSITTAKARLNTHTHKIDNIESRKRSPEGYTGPPSPSSSNDVMVFTSSHHGSGSRPGHGSRNLPEYPNIDEMHRYIQEVWDQKMREANDPNSKLKCLNLSKPNEKSYRKEGSPTASQPGTPSKQRNSPQHNKKF